MEDEDMEEEEMEEPEFDGYDDVPGNDEEIREIHEEILGSFEDIIKRLDERIHVGVIAPREWIGSFDENADSSSDEDWDSQEGGEMKNRLQMIVTRINLDVTYSGVPYAISICLQPVVESIRTTA